jgi:hypothetical protein
MPVEVYSVPMPRRRRLALRGGDAVLRAPRCHWFVRWSLAVVTASAIAACEPRVKIEAPSEPITINLNIKLDANVRVQLQREAEEDVKTKDIF